MPQIVHDATTTFSDNPAFPDGVSVAQWNHTVGVGDGRYLRVGFLVHGTVQVTHVKYAGELLNALDINPIAFGSKNLYWYWGVAPPEGTDQVEVDISNDGTHMFSAVSSSYLLVDQFVPHGTVASDTVASAEAISSQITLEEGGLGIDLIGAEDVALTADAGQTERANFGIGPGSGYGGARQDMGASDEGGGPGDITMGWSWSGVEPAGHIAVPLRPMAAARQRIYEYHENVYMSRAAGSPQVRDAQSRLVKPEQLRANNWVRVEGPQMIDTHAYDDAAEDPALVFAEIVGVRGENIILTPSRDSTAERILGRLTRK